MRLFYDKTSGNRLCGHGLVKKITWKALLSSFCGSVGLIDLIWFEIWSSNGENLSSVGQNKKKKVHASRIYAASPKSAYLVFSLGKSSSTLDSGIHLSELCPLHKCTTRLLYNVYNRLLDWRLCVKTARRSPCQRLCETGAQWRLHKVLWVLFLICMAQMSFCSCAGSREGGRESGGDCHMGWTRSVSRKLFQWKILGLHCLHTGTDKCREFQYIPRECAHWDMHRWVVIHLGPQMTVGPKDFGPALFLHPLLGPFPDPLCLCSLLSSFHAHMHPRDFIMYTHSLMPSDVKCPTLAWACYLKDGQKDWVWQSPDPWSLQSKSSTFPTPSPSYRVYPILLCYPTPPTHPHSHEKALKQRHSLQGKHWGPLSTKTG